MQFNVLGPLEVLDSAGPRTIRRGRPRVLLHLLLLQRRVVVPVDVMADRLWEDEQPLDASNAVHQLISYLRRALGDEGRHVLITGPTGYMLDVAEDQVDAGVLEQLVQSVLDGVASGTVEAATGALEDADRAARLWRGEPYVESSGFEWATADIQRLKDAYLVLQEARLEAMLRLGKHREVILEATSLVSAYPLREQLHGHLSLALYRSGRQSEALDVHRKLRALLADELGIDPAAPLQSLERQILNQDAALDWQPPAGKLHGTSERTPAEATPAPRIPPDVDPPTYLSPLRGRQADVENLTLLTQSTRLLTLVGPPGVGKSRLAAQLNADSAAEHRWFVDLSDVSSGEVVAGTVATKLSVEGQFPNDAHERLAAALNVSGDLVLDGCEAVIDGVSALLRRLLDKTSELRVVVTSRRPLQLPGEVVYRLEPLAVPSASSGSEIVDAPSVQLFLDRARSSTGRSWERLEDLRHVEAIVSALDGLPLAIELAAANVDVLGLPALSSRLKGQLDYLVQPGPHAPVRHQSLRAAIRASVDLLGESEHAFFTELAVFPGSFDLDAAAAVTLRTGAAAYELVASLVRQSLLVTDVDSRYRYLAPVRDLALELLVDQPSADEVRHRHALYVAEVVAPLAAETHRQNQEQALARLRRLLSDARAALRWAVDHGEATVAIEIASAYSWFWTLAGMTDEGIMTLLQVRELVERSGDDWSASAVYAELLRNLGLLANPAGRLDLAEDACAEAAALSRRLEDWDGAARALLTLGIARWAKGDYELAARAHDDAAAMLERGASDWSHTAALVLRARTALDAGEKDTEARIESAITATRRIGDKHMAGLATLIHARWAYLSGQVRLAEVAAREALQGWRSIDYREGEIGALNLLARIALDTEGPAVAEPLLCEALHISAASGHLGGQCETFESFALVAAATGRFEHAYLLYCVASLERHRIGAAAPAADLNRLLALEDSCSEVLGPAAELVRARARVMDFANVRDDLLRR